MTTTSRVKLVFLALLVTFLVLNFGCGGGAGCADVYLEGITIGSMSIEGKPVTGLPSQKVNLLLNVNANKITVNASGGKTTITVSPSGATIVSGPDGITFSGVKPEQVEIKWQSTETTK